jgi:DNA mismatch repair protein MutL
MARMTAIPYGRVLTSEEMLLVVSELFASRIPGYTPDGLKVVNVLSDMEIEKKMQ